LGRIEWVSSWQIKAFSYFPFMKYSNVLLNFFFENPQRVYNKKRADIESMKNDIKISPIHMKSFPFKIKKMSEKY
jgi:hypothetical protein